MMATFMTVLAAIIWVGGGLSGFIVWFADGDLFTITLIIWISALIFGSILYSISLVLKNQEDIRSQILDTQETILRQLTRIEKGSSAVHPTTPAQHPPVPGTPTAQLGSNHMVSSAFKKMDALEKNNH